MSSGRRTGGRIERTEISGAVCGFKEHPLYIASKDTKTLFPESCSCVQLSDSSTKPVDPTSRNLCLVNILADKTCLEFAHESSRWSTTSAWAWVSSQYLKATKGVVVIHPGQVEAMHHSIDAGSNVVILIDEDSSEHILSVCVALINCGLSSISYKVESAKLTEMMEDFLLSKLVSDQRESLSDLKKLAVASDRCSPRIILALSTEGTIEELVNGGEEEMMLTQAVITWSTTKLQIDFDACFSLKQFISNSRNCDSLAENLKGHLSFSRNILEKPSLKESLNFLLDYSRVVSHEYDDSVVVNEAGETEANRNETSFVQRIAKLREIIRVAGGDLGFSGETEHVVQSMLNKNPFGFQDATVGPLGIYFYPAAVLAVCALTLLPGPIRMFIGRSGVEVNKTKLFDRAEDLYRFLGLQTVCQRPCESVSNKLAEGLAVLETRDLIAAVTQPQSDQTSALLARRLARDLESSDDEEARFYEDVMLKISTSSASIQIIEEFADILRDKISVMYICYLKLPDILVTGSLRKSHFEDKIKEHMRVVCEGMIDRPVEASTKDIRHQIKAIVDTGVLDEITLRGERWLVTTEDFSNSQDRLAAGQQCMHLLNLVAKYVL